MTMTMTMMMMMMIMLLMMVTLTAALWSAVWQWAMCAGSPLKDPASLAPVDARHETQARLPLRYAAGRPATGDRRLVRRPLREADASLILLTLRAFTLGRAQAGLLRSLLHVMVPSSLQMYMARENQLKHGSHVHESPGTTCSWCKAQSQRSPPAIPPPDPPHTILPNTAPPRNPHASSPSI
jgi:hypothetical protein